VHLLRLALKQLVLYGPYQARTCEVELDGKIRSIHFEGFAVRFVVDVLASTTERRGIARCDEEFQIFGRRRGEIDEPVEQRSTTEALTFDQNVHTSGSSCHSKGRGLLETEI